VNDKRSDEWNEAIRRTAYFLWEQDGRPAGKEAHYWQLAREKHLRQRAYDLWLAEGAPEGKAETYWDRARNDLP